jgi:glycosyltransferase involved in cell wall biosynthesis
MLVSIIIPTYKGSINLARAIDSALNQTYTKIEIIVVDDNNSNSIDRKKTELLLDTYNSKDVLYIQHDYNKNGSAARNTGFRHSKGDFIALLDDDDHFTNTKIEEQVNFLINNKRFHAVYCWFKLKSNVVSPLSYGDLTKEVLLLESNVVTPSLLIRREAFQELNGFDETFVRHQDYEFLIRFFEKYEIGLVKKNLLNIGNNGGINQKKEEDLDELKRYFFKKFEKKIIELTKNDKSFYSRVKIVHYTPVFWSHVKSKRFDLTSNIFKLYLKNNKVGFLIKSIGVFKKQFLYIKKFIFNEIN